MDNTSDNNENAINSKGSVLSTDSTILLVCGNMNTFGTIVNANLVSDSMFDLKKDELIGKNITCMMPPNISQYHIQLIDNFYDTMNSNILNTDLLVMCKN